MDVIRNATANFRIFEEDFYAPLPSRIGLQDRDPRAWIRGVCFSPDGAFFAVDANNNSVVKYARNVSGKFKIEAKRTLSHRPRDIAYMSTFWNGTPFEGVAITLETNKMAYYTLSLEVWRLLKTEGDYSGICRLPNTNLLVVINTMHSSVDVITIYAQPLYSYRMPNHICKSHGYVTVTMFMGNPVIVVSCQMGIICMKLDWSGSLNLSRPELFLKSVQRYVPPANEKFKSEGVCAQGPHVLVADFTGNRVMKFRLLTGDKDTNRVDLYKIGEHEVSEPLAVDIIPLEEGSAQIGVARHKGRPPEYHLLKFINITIGDKPRHTSVCLYTPTSSLA